MQLSCNVLMFWFRKANMKFTFLNQLSIVHTSSRLHISIAIKQVDSPISMELVN
ncbi:hypothetical protein HanRHA438_Chr10g0452161 [Helianthus annuus]|nr:hypothetical protein HanIR_Chr10g0474221 [Helianthus annuus]KAJ0879494.1 hypothetical protein HanRHA438_Chr10g0452161 [Helianthus annuus]